ncbi:MAG: hypothetical protein BWK78_00425 [Thiotrichaceae bacterium IS1]|nr:MAG: hypothetical protein BWK78_00425 [Thiotrichaceae bacterium IS1]
MSGLLLEGNLYLKRLTDPVDIGFVAAGNAVKAEIEIETESKERLSKQKGSYGTALDSVVIPKPPKFNVTVDELAERRMLAIALMGTVTVETVAGSTVDDEAVTVTHDQFIALAHQNISAVTVTDSTGVTTYTEGTDYELNLSLGWISALSTGVIADSASIKVSYTYAASNAFTVKGNTQSIIKCEVMLDGINKADGQKVVFHAHRWAVSPSSAMDLLGDEFVSSELSGTLELPAGKDEPYTLTIG